MASNLATLLVDLGEDVDLQTAYANEKETVMANYALSDAEKSALQTGDESAIQDALGGGAVICKIIVKHGGGKK